MPQAYEIKGGAIVHNRTQLYEFGVGEEGATYTFAEATYTGDIDGPATETFVAVKHSNGSESHYGHGIFTGRILGKSGTLNWKFKGKPGQGEIEIVSGTAGLDGIEGKFLYILVEGSRTEFTYHGMLELRSKE